ncbi:RCC1 domain-containing protein [Actinophytocola gossypii]|uniref:RCC1-like domain-containing protein n=1 Tax=Actinophytocola gossypii TaxID=2812003 RepID=A0ABT2JBF8_9PSEU|nr:hypothetical protein [Actinophytocola gossypii]MCT2584634.1 hypothetical protein [Actinophytocola gossypii]
MAATYTATTPVRVLDTRHAVGSPTTTPVGPRGSLTVDLSERLPATATAVVLNVTAVAPTASTYITAWPAGTPRPDVSNLNLAPGETRPNMVTVALGTSRTVSLYNNAGSTHLLADLSGYYSTGAGARYTGRDAERVAAIRLPARGTGDLDLAPFVPSSAVAVVLNVTGTRATANTYVTAWPTDAPRPGVSALNLAAGRTSANLVTVPLGADRGVSLYNNAGTIDTFADLVGFYTPEFGAVFAPVTPTRVFDTRNALGTGLSTPQAIPARSYTHMLPGNPLPGTAVSAVLNLTGVAPTADTYLTVYQSRIGSLPSTSSVEVARGQITSNLTVARVESNPPWTRTFVYNHNGATHTIADLTGYFWVPPTDCTTDCAVVWGHNRGTTGTGTTTDHVTRPASPTGLDGVIAIADHAAVRDDGTVWTWGGNSDGQLGTGWRGGDSTIPLRVTGLADGVAVASAERANLALRSDGTVWAWGTNDNGLLGRTGSTASAVPVRVPGLNDVTAIAAANGTAYAVRADGSVWAWGANSHGQLGRGVVNNLPQPQPAPVPDVTDITAVATSGDQTYALRGNGTVLAWGYNLNGEMGNGSTGTMVPSPVQVSGLTDVVAISGDLGNGFAAKSDGTVWAWGQGGWGVLGIENACQVLPDCAATTPRQVPGLSDIVDLAGLGDAVIALDSTGQVHGWGSNTHRELPGTNVGFSTATPLPLPDLTHVENISNGTNGGRAVLE